MATERILAVCLLQLLVWMKLLIIGLDLKKYLKSLMKVAEMRQVSCPANETVHLVSS